MLTGACMRVFVVQIKVSINMAFRKISNIDTIHDRFSADVLVEASWREPRLDGQSQQQVRAAQR